MKRLLLALVVALATTSSAYAVVATPTLFYDFQQPGRSDFSRYLRRALYRANQLQATDCTFGITNAMARAVNHSALFFRAARLVAATAGCEGGTAAAPNEHYVTAVLLQD